LPPPIDDSIPPPGCPPPPGATCPPQIAPSQIRCEVWTLQPEVYYWIAVRCWEGCSAQVCCYSGSYAPCLGDGWTVIGPYSHCPDQSIFRYVWTEICGRYPPGEPPPPPTLPPIGIDPSDGTRPPPRDPPPRDPPRVDPPPGECPPIVHPPRWQASTPYCHDEGYWLQPAYQDFLGSGDIGEMAEKALARYPEEEPENPLAEFWE
jgi:hypothetical protein